MASNIRVAELDFDLIKENLKQFLRSKPEFTDYNFEGSGLSVIMDLLAYNTHYNAITANMLLQELFLDTAVKKESVALIAKRLGYTPKSYTAPKAIVDVQVFPPTGDFPNTLTLAKNSTFTANLNYKDTVKFVNREAITISKSETDTYMFKDVEIYEGSFASFRYVYDSSINQKFEIPSKFVDTSLVTVKIQKSGSNTETTTWTNFNNIIDVKADTKAYFIKLNESLNYEVYFGDGILGKPLDDGNIIIIEYLATNGDVANNLKDIYLSDAVDGYTNTTTTVLTPAFGGAVAESISNIKTNAQASVLNQNRAVTEGDYAAIINNILPMESIVVYGGETLTPPVYGKVFISAKQYATTSPLNATQKQNIIDVLKKKSVMGIIVDFIDPEYINLSITTEVKYNPNLTIDSKSTLVSQLFNAIKSYGTTNLNKFDSNFDLYSLMSYINNVNNSFISNDTKIVLKKTIKKYFNTNYTYELNFFSAIKQSNSKELNINSSQFYLDEDQTKTFYISDSDGTLYVYYTQAGQKIIFKNDIGTIDYSTGKLKFNINLSTNNVSDIVFSVVPEKLNFISSKNNILTISDSDIHISMVGV